MACGKVADAVERARDCRASPAVEVARDKPTKRHGNDVGAFERGHHHPFQHPGEESASTTKPAAVERRVWHTDRCELAGRGRDVAQHFDVQDFRLRRDTDQQTAANLACRERGCPRAVTVLVRRQIKRRVGSVGHFAIGRAERRGVGRHGKVEHQVILHIGMNRIYPRVQDGDFRARAERHVPCA